MVESSVSSSSLGAGFCKNKFKGKTSVKNIKPIILNDHLQPTPNPNAWDRGVKMACPRGLPASANPRTVPLVAGNHGDRVAIAVNEEIDVWPTAAMKL